MSARVALVAAVALVVGVGAFSFARAWQERFDYSHFIHDARYVWAQGALPPLSPAPGFEADARQLPFYLPTVSVALAPLGALPRMAAAGVWALLQMLTLGATLTLLWRWCSAERRTATFVLLLLLGAPVIYEAARFNQLTFPTLALVLVGAYLLSHSGPGRESRGVLGAGLLAAATVLKLLPVVFVVWLVLKRRWVATAAFTVCVATFTLLPPVMAFGWRDTLRHHGEWIEHNLAGVAKRGLDDAHLRAHFRDHRNQSLPALAGRWLTADHPNALPHRPLTLSESQARLVAYGGALVLFGGLIAWARRPARMLGSRELQAEAALFALAMVALSPLLRQYYLAWALPALAMVLSATQLRAWSSRVAAWVGAAVWIAGMLAWLSPTLRLMGVHFFMLVLLAVTAGLAVRAPSRAARRGESTGA